MFFDYGGPELSFHLGAAASDSFQKNVITQSPVSTFTYHSMSVRCDTVKQSPPSFSFMANC